MSQAYSMAFTTGTLFFHESLTVAQTVQRTQDWQQARAIIMEDNLLQMRTTKSSRTIYSEIASRLQLLTSPQLNLLVEGQRPEQLHLLWLAICKRYRFIREFSAEIVREKFLRLDLQLTYAEYDSFYYDKAEWHPEVARIAESTRRKVRQVIFKMLREADLLTAENLIVPTTLSPAVIRAIAAEDPAFFTIYPIPEFDVTHWTP